MPDLPDRLPDEPPHWYRRFLAYLRLGGGRSVDAVFHQERDTKGRWHPKHRRANRHWYKRAERHDWEGRAAAYDRALIEEAEREWIGRQNAIRDREWDTALRLLEKADEMLQFPTARRTVPDPATGEPVVVEPARWTFDTAVRMFQMASKLARLASGLETDRLDFRAYFRRRAAEEGLSDEEAERAVREAERLMREAVAD